MDNTLLPEVTTFLIERVLKNSTGEYNKEEHERLHLLTREKATVPIIYVGTGSCGMAAGADDTLQAVYRFIRENKISAEVVEVGCIGLCSEEPLMDVQIPGKCRVSFRQVTAEKAEEFLRSAFNKTIQNEDVLGQYTSSQAENWANIPFIEQLPFFSFQCRILLKDAGLISPSSIMDFLAKGGY